MYNADFVPNASLASTETANRSFVSTPTRPISPRSSRTVDHGDGTELRPATTTTTSTPPNQPQTQMYFPMLPRNVESSQIDPARITQYPLGQKQRDMVSTKQRKHQQLESEQFDSLQNKWAVKDAANEKSGIYVSGSDTSLLHSSFPSRTTNTIRPSPLVTEIMRLPAKRNFDTTKDHKTNALSRKIEFSGAPVAVTTSGSAGNAPFATGHSPILQPGGLQSLQPPPRFRSISDTVAIGSGVSPSTGSGSAQADAQLRISNPYATTEFGSRSNSPLATASDTMDYNSLLHNSCKLYPTTITIVESALRFDPEGIRRKVSIVCERNMGGQTSKLQAVERYVYPINIALRFNAALDVLQLLASKGPEVLMESDGLDHMSSLGIALALGHQTKVIYLLLSTNPRSARTRDRYSNLPLHVAVRQPSITLEIVEMVHMAFPEAIKARNFHGQTPLDVAVRTVACPDAVLNYLQISAFGQLEAAADHFDDSDFI
jgi:hypothetical protein